MRAVGGVDRGAVRPRDRHAHGFLVGAIGVVATTSLESNPVERS